MKCRVIFIHGAGMVDWDTGKVTDLKLKPGYPDAHWPVEVHVWELKNSIVGVENLIEVIRLDEAEVTYRCSCGVKEEANLYSRNKLRERLGLKAELIEE